ncbi:hypothetical protein MAR_006525 [Mya arenaria]|uniref:EGF-like domain-containing protein n=1 Tax=Mya arenaria TaxID=6604 RepID=A0ABY7DCE5_MYAAR|nr:hypothetical protein MAR_006525 [Mya arenaria]
MKGIRDTPISLTDRDTPISLTDRDTPISVTLRYTPISLTLRDTPISVTLRYTPISLTLRDTQIILTLRDTPISLTSREKPISITTRDTPISLLMALVRTVAVLVTTLMRCVYHLAALLSVIATTDSRTALDVEMNANVEEQCFCDAQCPPTSFCNSNTHECECISGYEFDGSACVTDPDGPGAGLNDACDGDGGNGARAAINCINWPVFKCQVVLGTGPPPIKVCSCNGPRGYIYNETTMECDCTKTVGGCAND